MTTRLILLCHGATEATRRFSFPADEPLEARALSRAASLAGLSRRIDRVVTSPATAARQTASFLGNSASAEPALRDIDFGVWRGLTLSDVQARDPYHLRRWLEDGEFSPPGGEAFASVVARVSGWLDDELLNKGRVVAVTHASVIRAAVIHVLGAPVHAFPRLDVAPLSRTEFSGDGRHWRLRAVGLPPPAQEG